MAATKVVKKQKKKEQVKVAGAATKPKKVSNDDKIKELEAEMSKMQYNKRTQHHYGLLRAKIAMLKKKDEARSSKKGKTEGYAVRRSGDATVILVGFPSAGKSSLLNELTNADSPVGSYEFTTLSVVPGLLEYKGAKIQILDVPGIVAGAASGKGRGREVLSVLQNADLGLILLDTLRPNAKKVIEKEIFDSHLRLNKKKPDVKIKKTMKNGIRIGRTVPTPELTDIMIKSICKEFKISNADVLIRSKINSEEFIDVLENNKIYIPGLIALNKIDLVDYDRLEEITDETGADIGVSAQKKVNLEELKELIFSKLEFIRVYCKEVGKPADMKEPLILRKGVTVEGMCLKLHKDFVKKFKFSRIWGPSAKFPGQRLMLQHVLQDEDVVEIHVR